MIAPHRTVNRDATIPTGTALALVLTNSTASDTSAVEDAEKRLGPGADMTTHVTARSKVREGRG